MAKPYEEPLIQKKNTAVKTIEEKKAALGENIQPAVVTTSGPTEKTDTDITVIYCKQVDQLKSFLMDEFTTSDLDVRRKEQMKFIQLPVKMIELKEFNKVKTCLLYLMKTIVENPDAFSYEKVLKPLEGIEKSLPPQTKNQYVMFMTFITAFTKNIKNKQAFASRFDVPSFVKLFSEPGKSNLNRFIHD